MGYDVNIQREEGKAKITTKEWLDFIENDSQFKCIERFSGELQDSDILKASTPNAGLWNKNVPFTFNSEYGMITVKNPNQGTVLKMVQIAKALDSKVVGEEGEEYDQNYTMEEMSEDKLLELAKNLKVKPFDFKFKKWWQFWK